MKNSRCLEKLGHPIGQKEWRISDQLPIRQYIWKNQHKIRPWSYVNSKSRVLTITTWGPQPHNSSFYMQSLSNFTFWLLKPQNRPWLAVVAAEFTPRNMPRSEGRKRPPSDWDNRCRHSGGQTVRLAKNNVWKLQRYIRENGRCPVTIG